MTEKITSNQENRIMDLVRDMMRGLNLTKEEAQNIIKKGGILQQQVKPIFQKLVITDQHFGPVEELCKVTIPINFNSATCIDEFQTNVNELKTTHYYNDNLTSKNFSNPSNTLVPGKTYTVKMIPIVSGNPESNDCLAQIAKAGGIPVGAQGLTVIDTNLLPKGKWYVSFDQKENLWRDSDGRHGVPCVVAYDDGDFEFHLGYFGRTWDADNVLLCFCDESLEA